MGAGIYPQFFAGMGAGTITHLTPHRSYILYINVIKISGKAVSLTVQ